MCVNWDKIITNFDMRLSGRAVAMLVVLPIFALCVACGEDPLSGDNPNNNPGEGGTDGYEDIKVVDGKVRFYLSEQENSTRTASGMSARNWATSKVVVNGKSYSVEMTDEETARPYVEVVESGSYNAVLQTPSSGVWFEGSAYSNVKLPHSQIYHMESAHLRSFPMYAAYAKETGNKLIFNDGFAMIRVKLTGSDKIASIKVENPVGRSISGISHISPTKPSFSVSKGMNYVVLNATNKGEFVQLDPAKECSFRLIIAPGSYPEGLKISICDSQRGAMFVTTPALELAAGQVYTVEKNYACESDLLFYEGFDTFVWGGDVLKGEKGYGFSPSVDSVPVDSGSVLTLTGYEVATSEVPYNYAGSAFIQSNNWNLVSGLTVGESHQMSDSYVASRNLADMGYMFRVQEHPGYVAIGAATQDRGIIQTPIFSKIKTISKAKITIDMALQTGFDGELLMELINGGVIERATLNGKPLTLTPDNLYYRYETSYCKLFKEALVIPSSATEPQEWNRLELIVNAVTDGTKLYIADGVSTKGTHGIYIDRIEVREIEEWGKRDYTMRVLLWNILAGMWTDQHNNYDNFVEWVKKYDPDVCIWTESETIYYDNSKDQITDKTQCYLTDGWAELGARFGHNYMAVSGNRDNYPQTVTSKYPINIVQKITDTHVKNNPVVHGSGHFVVEVNGKKINIVTVHMWPMEYFFGTSTSDTRGDYYREFEMQYIVDNTINHSNYAGEEHWLLAGDTNSHSRLDAWYHNYPEDSPKLITHDVIRNQTNMKDAIGERYPENHFIETYPTHQRIDFIYVTPELFGRIDNSTVLIDNWCYPRRNGNVQNWYAPSDHRPVLVDFIMR